MTCIMEPPVTRRVGKRIGRQVYIDPEAITANRSNLRASELDVHERALRLLKDGMKHSRPNRFPHQVVHIGIADYVERTALRGLRIPINSYTCSDPCRTAFRRYRTVIGAKLAKTLADIAGATKPDGKAIVSYPRRPRLLHLTPEQIQRTLELYFQHVTRPVEGDTKVFEASNPK
jgi:hypothetical protein